MPQEIEKELKEIEQSLYNVECNYGGIARDAVRKRFAYEIARATAIETIEHRELEAGQKKPTVAVMEAQADLMIRKELEESRYATAELDIAKTVLDSLQSRLSAIQTRAKMSQMEMALAR